MANRPSLGVLQLIWPWVHGGGSLSKELLHHLLVLFSASTAQITSKRGC